MRTIKFKVWEKPQEDFKGKMWNDNDPMFWANCLMNEKDEYELLQFTGLKDKNGKEIYCSDIISFGRYKNGFRNHRVFYSKDGFWEADGSVLGYTLKDEDVEIIGNIYETPELLNK